jgi:hypothetical protein
MVKGGVMSWRRAMAGVIGLALAWGAIGSGAQPDPGASQVPPDVARIVMALRTMGERLRASLHLSTMGVVSPTRADQRLYAGQVVNLLVGPGGPHFNPLLAQESPVPGLLPDAQALLEFLPGAEIPDEARERVTFLVRKIHAFLTMARDESVQALRSRRLDQGSVHMLRAFAFLNAALGRETDPPHLGGVLALLRILPPVL